MWVSITPALTVTGRELSSLQGAFPALDVFDRVVAENGALLYNPATQEERLLAARPSAPFVEALRARGVSPLSVGSSIVAQRIKDGTITQIRL